jgi:hypothetical protein
MGEHRASLLLNIALFTALVFSLLISYTGILGLTEYISKL